MYRSSYYCLFLLLIFASCSDSKPVTESVAITAGRNGNMAMGNPSGADGDDMRNYLVEKTQYTLSYNADKGIPNWVSWHLSSAWKGDAKRCNCFDADDELPKDGIKAIPNYYTKTGFDRGHLCPSDDRDGSDKDNRATFLMCNIAPQAPNLNRDVWEKLESYCRKLVADGNELYIIAGAYGSGGTGAKGRKEALEGGIYVPSYFWKVIVVLPVGENDVNRIDHETRVIAVNMPNDQSANQYQWAHYRVSVDDIEKATGYNLLSNVIESVQDALEEGVDDGEIH